MSTTSGQIPSSNERFSLICLMSRLSVRASRPSETPRRHDLRQRDHEDSALKCNSDWLSHLSLQQIQACREGTGQRVHALRSKQADELVVVQQPAQRVDEEQQPALRQVGLLDQQLL